MSLLQGITRRLLPPAVRGWLRRAWTRSARLDMGDLRSSEPPSRLMALDRGQPVDRWYIERFLANNVAAIRGRVLEVADAEYTKRFGGARVTASDVLHVQPGMAGATVIGDLASGEGIPRDQYDTLIVTQVLQFIYDIHGAVRTMHAALAMGGTALATMTVIAPVSRYDATRWGEYWRPTEQGARRLFEDVFGVGNVVVEVHGNHITAHASIAGIAAEELRADELAARDADYPVVVTVVATRRR